ncbi:hypothetical protein HU830_02035 [Lactobacillus sp. DCY120]|uniref:Acyl-ACP thioesterase n=1 Tax=Bombilactobacillus apium TaxID=2675299 RepID=A0A850R0T9_9LACO|nr:acyl-ACP thioesterase domain-containing protein [Bombilactobacillus apium]NVY95970.1 hypothetical protein [Bombilactobacillus apium]
MKASYSESFVVPFYFIDSSRKMKLSALFDALLLASEHQLHAAGIDSQQLVHEHQLGWVVTKYHLEVQRWPVLDEKITLTTEATSYNKFFCYRTFTAHDAQGKQLLQLTSNWVMLDIQKRKMVPTDPQIMELLDCPYTAKVESFPRIDRVEYQQPPILYRTRFFDIDVNGHVNNSIYFDWMLDSLGQDFLVNHNIQTFDIKYEHEVPYQETIQSFVRVDDLTTHHLIRSTAGVSAQAQITWREN